MPIEKQIIHAGMRLKHPSGVEVTTTLEDLHNLKDFNLRSISFFQEQIRLIDADIAQVEKKVKAQEER